jgi:enoyl-CoA hydratase/carnithine racemase
MTPSSAEVVLLDTLPTADGRRFGVATLNAPAALNALSLAMVQRLAPALQRWASDPQVVGVILQGSGEKAFCAGGDLRGLYQTLRDCGSATNTHAEDFFAQEYALDYAIHTYPKPLLCWGQGIVMGGGIGLMAGASHRVVTTSSKLAMPEISIGLYPDVGGSWILRRMAGRVGLFLALTGAHLNAADALFCGLADFHVGTHTRDELQGTIAASHWTDDAAQNRSQLSRLLDRMADTANHSLPVSQVRTHWDSIQALIAGDDLLDIAARLRELHSGDAWLDQAASSFNQGSPTSAALSFALWQRVRHMSLAEVFRLEYSVSLGCCAHPDLAEGIRALLIDKDRRPLWTPAMLEEVTPEWIEAHFQPRFIGPHPLQALR